MTSTPNHSQPAPWHQLTPADLAGRMGTDLETGLSSAAAERALRQFGPNDLEETGGRSIWQILWDQMASSMIAILAASALLAAFLGKPVDAMAIAAIVVVFVVLGFLQEYRAQKAIAALKQLAAPTVRVLRNGGVREISGRELVPGDLVKLEAGGVVPADCRIVESVNLRVQEAALTGEAEPIEKVTHPLDGGADLPLGDRVNMGYRGTFVGFGRGTGLVVATGMATELGKVARLVQNVEAGQTPLQKRLEHLGRVLAVVAVAIAALVILARWVRGDKALPGGWSDLLLTGVSLAVAIVPEGLPAVLTFTLALGAQRMLKRQALVRKLPAVEALGSVTVICSDKTGTLTQNRMTVTDLAAPGLHHELDADNPAPLEGGESALRLLAQASALCNDAVLEGDRASGWRGVGDPTEVALAVAAAHLGLHPSSSAHADHNNHRLGEWPFDSDRKRMTTLHAIDARLAELLGVPPNRGAVAFVKGAVDGLAPLCQQIWVNGQSRPFDANGQRWLTDTNELWAAGGKRVLAVAMRLWPEADGAPRDPGSAGAVEQQLVLLGLVGMIDSARPEARAAVDSCWQAGIRPIMITGDHPVTARAIAVELGIIEPGAPVMTGRELAQADEASLRQAVEQVRVFARVSPEHKLHIVGALQANGHVVAMTGDGVNDAPALRKADIGVAMGTGTDVAKEAADIVLLDDNFATIVAAIEEGRVVYDNLRRFVAFSITGNIGKVLAVAAAPIIGLAAMLKPIQILWLNLMTDGLLGLGTGFEKGEANTMRRPPYAPDESVFCRGIGYRALLIGPLIGATLLGLGWVLQGENPGEVSTKIFLLMALIQAGQALSLRSFRLPAWRIPAGSNPVLWLMIVLVAGLQMLVIYLPAAQTFFHTTALPGYLLASCVVVALFLLGVAELEKRLRNHRS